MDTKPLLAQGGSFLVFCKHESFPLASEYLIGEQIHHCLAHRRHLTSRKRAGSIRIEIHQDDHINGTRPTRPWPHGSFHIECGVGKRYRRKRSTVASIITLPTLQ